ncbi:MAG: glycosyltransferase family 2 protein [Catonella sp.]|uniref:glycosyltransferase family 2 protein n=1 Tax=Catonella sp. TaxID=2382125 RepID=UPI003FA0AF73
MNKKIVILIPCYNEVITIGKVVSDFKKEVPEAEVIVYDNNSSDGTDEVARKAGAKVFYEYKQGKGNVVRSMFRNIEADCYVLVDGDDTYPASAVKELIKPVLDDGADMVVGDRLSTTYFTENKRAFHNFGNKLVKGLINKLFKGSVNDIMTGYRAFSKSFVKSFPIVSKGFEIETEMTIHALDKNMYIVEVPIEYKDRPEGSVSKLNTVQDGIKVMGTIAKLFRDYKPFVFFSAISILVFLFGFIFFVGVLIEYFETGLVSKIPTLIVSSLIMWGGVSLWLAGVILHVIVGKHRQLFELQMNILDQLDKINSKEDGIE